MPITLVLIILAGLLATGLFLASQWKRYRIRRTGKRVMAKVTRVKMWQEAPRADFSFQSQMIPAFGDRWRYEIRAEWTNPCDENTYIFTSGVKNGLPGHQQGDYLTAYVSSYGTYLSI